MSFEKKLNRANEILESLNNDELSLKQSVEIYKEGLKNIKEAREILEKASLEVEQIDE